MAVSSLRYVHKSTPYREEAFHGEKKSVEMHQSKDIVVDYARRSVFVDGVETPELRMGTILDCQRVIMCDIRPGF